MLLSLFILLAYTDCLAASNKAIPTETQKTFNDIQHEHVQMLLLKKLSMINEIIKYRKNNLKKHIHQISRP